jgi:hypothetical protein
MGTTTEQVEMSDNPERLKSTLQKPLKIMSGTLAAIGRKTLSLALIFNSMISLVSIGSVLSAFYVSQLGWQPYAPYLINGSLLWLAVLTAVLNIVPAKLIGKVKIGRVLFHHYVYGLLASSIPFALIAVFAPAYLLVLLIPDLGFQMSGLQMLPAYAGSFFVYGGLTLVIDDIRDVSLRLGRTFDKLKMWAFKSSNILQKVHLSSSLASLYVTICIIAWGLENIMCQKTLSIWDISQLFFMASLLITSLWGLKVVKAKLWFTKLYEDLVRMQRYT